MDPTPPSQTVSRSTSWGQISALADAALQAPLPSSAFQASANPSASVSRSRAPSDHITSMTAIMQCSSLSGSSAYNAPPPSYRTSQNGAPRPPVVGLSSRLTTADSKQRVHQLRLATKNASDALPRRDTAGLFKAACSTDLLFLIDVTASMKPHLEAVKAQVLDTMEEIKHLFLNESETRIAVVAYRDHDVEPKPDVEFLDFTTDHRLVYKFVQDLSTHSGWDTAEDVLSGIWQASLASWKQHTRCMLHIGDSPLHGEHLNDLVASEEHDKYRKPGSEPHGLMPGPVVYHLIELRVNYIFLRIDPSTDRMTKEFGYMYAMGGANVRLLPENKYYRIVGNGAPAVTPTGTHEVKNAELVFIELRLGNQYQHLKNLIVKAVTHSVSAATARLSVAMSRENTKARTGRLGVRTLPTIGEGGPGHTEQGVVWNTLPPCWNSSDWLDQSLRVEGACPEVVVYTAQTLNDMVASDKNIKMSFAQLTLRTRSRPFGRGAMRAAYYARMEHSTGRFVVKAFLDGQKGVEHMVEDMQMQALCKAFALEFNGLVTVDPPLDFVVTSCLKSVPGNVSGPATFKEDTPNDKFNSVAQAFSHFTLERSFGHFMVVDLQGVDNLLTDPAIHTKDTDRFKLNDTNLNNEGFKCFFSMHTCNHICKKLGLKCDRSMAVSGNYQFRETWPAMEPTVCCSNKFCHRIIRLVKAHKSEKFAGYHWCDSCWVQLQVPMTAKVCAGPGDVHEFDLSNFFYESQGRYALDKCSHHIEKDTTASATVDAGRSLWNAARAQTQHRSISGSEW
ncbi:hypothetical protein QBC38DRAFT_509116 [Podospora fimiseda]|uniref:Alpha-type protein kinase domain-containing protein n=1 Tax=Podospora fimiseda TaxID=252190 RepID=A0AAN7GW54_9PEZI|nr:hypothetical protein QBC38DRAFT_509116 [Podospora fimiseda]